MSTGDIPFEPSLEADTSDAARKRSWGEVVGSFFELTKPRITALVLVTAAAGFFLGSGAGFEPFLFVNAIVGIALVAAGTSAMNQVLERDVDALMLRTRGRPVPTGRIAAIPAAVFSGLLAGLGVMYLAMTVNALTAILAAICFAMYDFVYTPLKRVHSFSTVIGAIPGALPILGGWTAASGRLEPGGWALFMVMFLWQLPHFLALAWLLREDYRAAGLQMLTVGDERGVQTRHQTLIYTLVLLPVTLLPTLIGLAGPIYFIGAILLGAGFVWYAAQFSWKISTKCAQRLFRYSIFYLPVLLLLLVLDKF